MDSAQVDGILRSDRLTRTYLNWLIKTGFLQEITRGWYFVINPAASQGSTAWYGHYWSFVRQYLSERFREDYCLLPESSLRLLTGSTIVPQQLSVMRRSPGQQVLPLCLNTTLFIYQERGTFPKRIVEVNGIRVMDLSEALIRVPEGFYRDSAEEAIIALRLLRDPSQLLSDLLENGRSVVAGKLVGAFRQIGESATADRILLTMSSAGYDVRETNPFDKPLPGTMPPSRSTSPYVARIQGMWAAMRQDVIHTFPPPPGLPQNAQEYLERMDAKYVQDAYHSLSIEGYRVSAQLIERVRSGGWNPERDATDRETINALAARGYFEAFQAVKTSVEEILKGHDPAEVVRKHHHDWHRALFAPAVQAGLLTPATLAGYRQGPVYIRGSRHVPLPATL